MQTNSGHATSATELLRAEHDAVRELLARAREADAAAAGALVLKLGAALRIHARLEHDVFYPAFLEAADGEDDRRMFAEAAARHQCVEEALAWLERASGDGVSGNAEWRSAERELARELEAHLREEESGMLERVRHLVDVGKLRELGARMEAFRADLEEAAARASPGAT